MAIGMSVMPKADLFSVALFAAAPLRNWTSSDGHRPMTLKDAAPGFEAPEGF